MVALSTYTDVKACVVRDAGSPDSAVEVLLHRVADGVLAEDRREALADLRDLLSNNAQASDANCLQQMCYLHEDSVFNGFQ